uniref:Uncharacterized protein n=1 Tax=Hucho hucho TaxID=62062 RepID=A0A4W5RNT0_9TELE
MRASLEEINQVTGILIPICEFRTCTLREAIIIGSILTTCSIPVVHSRFFWQRWSTMEPTASSCDSYWTRNTDFGALPFRVLGALSATSCSSAVRCVSFLCSGTKVCSPWRSTTRPTWPPNRRMLCWSCLNCRHTPDFCRSIGSCRTRTRDLETAMPVTLALD